MARRYEIRNAEWKRIKDHLPPERSAKIYDKNPYAHQHTRNPLEFMLASGNTNDASVSVELVSCLNLEDCHLLGIGLIVQTSFWIISREMMLTIPFLLTNVLVFRSSATGTSTNTVMSSSAFPETSMVS